mmetsp:Transcript_113302/g.354320  ORF Transcript_113302/g.354320 Transcript_113302/m.354320 type:complete len:289 (+) Transcript_113302:579-1445(+)
MELPVVRRPMVHAAVGGQRVVVRQGARRGAGEAACAGGARVHGQPVGRRGAVPGGPAAAGALRLADLHVGAARQVVPGEALLLACRLRLRPKATAVVHEVQLGVLQVLLGRQEGGGPEDEVAEEGGGHADLLRQLALVDGADGAEERAGGQQSADGVPDALMLGPEVLRGDEHDHVHKGEGEDKGSPVIHVPALAHELPQREVGAAVAEGDDAEAHGVLGVHVVGVPEVHELGELREVPRVRGPLHERLQGRGVLQVVVGLRVGRAVSGIFAFKRAAREHLVDSGPPA